MEIKRITPEQAKELLDSNQGYIYLDVRTVLEFEAGHVVPVVSRNRTEILCNFRVKIRSLVWPSFRKLLKIGVKSLINAVIGQVNLIENHMFRSA